jgi:hypothetical protein
MQELAFVEFHRQGLETCIGCECKRILGKITWDVFTIQHRRVLRKIACHPAKNDIIKGKSRNQE